MFFFLLLAITLSGCGTGGPELESVNEKTGKPEPNFVIEHATPLPGNHKQVVNIVEARKTKTDDEEEKSDEEKKEPTKAFEVDHENWRVKTNHWIAVQNEGLSKKEDFNGVLTHAMVDSSFSPRKLPGTRYYLQTTRPASLAKEQPKKFETPAFIPSEQVLTIRPKLETSGGYNVISDVNQLLPLSPHQYHMVLLTEKPQNFKFMTVLPTIWNLRLNRHLQTYADFSEDAPVEIDYSEDQTTLNLKSLFYKLTISEWEDEPELPSNVQQWTSIAYLIWADDYSPEQFSPDQKQAIVDWLHFGGQLIVSSEAIETLNDSFLQPYLPARPTGKENAVGNQINELITNWSLEKDANGQLVHPTFSKDDKLVLTQWTLDESAAEVKDCAGLVVEREVGRGRVTCLAFPLNQTKLRSWSGFDNWFNGCLLRRPGRRFIKLVEPFNDNSYYQPGYLAQETQRTTSSSFEWIDSNQSEYKPDFYSNFRFLSRDWQVIGQAGSLLANSGPLPDVSSLKANAINRRFGDDNPKHSPGAWNEYSDISNAARRTLKDQAGITPPSRQWVLKALLIYLAVLVPGNYLIFRIMGKLEWAWFSIPLIAIIGGISVVRAASLDIGFSNKQLQINIVEFVPEYDRVHVTGYGSLYSSLTTSFRYTSENSSTFALPFPTDNVPTTKFERSSGFIFDVGKRVQFGPQQVISNTMEMYHFEQIADAAGTFYLDENGEVQNETKVSLSDTLVMRHNLDADRIEFAKVGSLPAGQGSDLKWQPLDNLDQLKQELSSTAFNDLEHEFRQLMEQLAAAEFVYESTSWQQMAAFFANDHPKFTQALIRNAESYQIETDYNIPIELALNAYMEAKLTDDMNLGRFGNILTNYPLGPGEVRLFGRSQDSLHDFTISPKASHVENHTIVVAQLKRPTLPKISHDLNMAYTPTSKKAITEENPDAESDE